MLQSGSMLQNRYRIIRNIGGGGMGIVYQAEDTRLTGRYCAIKEMSPALLSPEDRNWATNAFRQEAQMLATLNHPGLTPVTDFVSDKSNLYLVMEYVRGQTLEEILENAPNERLSRGQTLNIVRQLCDVLEYLHSQNPPVIFRDLKPSNVMLSSDNQVKLVDFGIARFFKSTQSQDTVTLGTPGYAAPEQWGTGGQSDARSDIYGLGVLLLRLVTGYDPTPNPFPLPQPRAVMPTISPKIEHLILRATPPQPELRYQSIAEFRRDMDTPSSQLRQDKTSVLYPPQHVTPDGAQAAAGPYVSTPTYSQPPDRSRNRTGLWIGLGFMAILLIGFCGVALGGGGAVIFPSLFGDIPTAQSPPAPTITSEENDASPVVITVISTGSPPTAQPDSPSSTPRPTPPPTVSLPTPTTDTRLHWTTIGQSVRGRDLDVGIIGGADDFAIVVVGSIQGDQSNTRDLVNYLADDFNDDRDRIPSNVTFYFIPTINPDGNNAGTRRNANNVDLNRNWDTFDWTTDPEQPGGVVRGAGGSHPHSEPETRSLANYMLLLQRQHSDLRLVLWHSSQRLGSGSGHVYPGYTSSGLDRDALTLAWRYANETGYAVKEDWAPYETTGELIIWCAEENIEAIDIVIPSSASGSSSSLRNTTMGALLEIARFP